MKNGREGADNVDNVISMENLRRRKRRKDRRKIRSVPAIQVRAASPQEEPAPSFDTQTERKSQEGRRFVPSIGVSVAAVAILLVLFASLFVAVTGCFDIKTIEIYGVEEEYREKILARADIAEGMNILRLSARKIAAGINGDPTLKFVKFEREWPDTVVLTVEHRGPACAVEYLGSYVQLDQSYTVLGIVPTDMSEGEYPVVYGIVAGQPIEIGYPLQFEVGAQKNALDSVMVALREGDALSRIREIHMEDLNEISMLAQDDIIVDIGSSENMSSKATWIAYMVPKLISDGRHGGTLYVSGGKNAFYSPEKEKPASAQDPAPVTPVPGEDEPEEPTDPEEL